MCTEIQKNDEKINLLAIETTTNVASIAVYHGPKLASELIINHNLTHSKTLLPNLKKVLEDAGMGFKDLDYIACDIGPGSFTGIRIGLATAKGLCQALNIPLIPVSSVASLTYNIRYVNGLICPMIDARRSQVYTGLFKADGRGSIHQIRGNQPVDLSEIFKWLGDETENIYVLGDGVEKYLTDQDASSNIIFVAPYLANCRASSVGAYALDHLENQQDYHSVEPVYLRPSYAEEKK